MIITETKPFGMIKAQLKKDDKISLVGCNMCARMCGTGGKEALNEMKGKLKDNGYNVISEFLFAPVCDRGMIKKIIKTNGNTILVLACDSGVSGLKEFFRGKKIIPALNTHGLGAFDEDGNIFMVREFK